MREKRINEKLVLKKNIKQKINKLLLSIIILLLGMIYTKKNPEMKKIIKEKMYEKSISFIQIKNNYQKYFGSIFLLPKSEKSVEPVFQEQIKYEKKKKYKNGVEIEVSTHYQVPALETGIIVFTGNKEEYGKTIIVEQIDGVDTYYSNIELKDKKIYDYIEKGEIIGEAIQNKIYFAFQKDGKFLDYEKFI